MPTQDGMISPLGRSAALPGLLIVWVVCCPSREVRAAIIGTRASAVTTVQELIADAPASVNADSVEFPSEGVTLPFEASSALTTTDLNGALTAFGQGFGQFLDPTRLDEPNPQEFAVEVGCYSNAERVAYRVESRVVETRSVRFSRSELDLSPSESSGEVTSRVFLSGAVLVWATTGATTAQDVEVELRLSVVRDDGATPLFETSLAVAGVNASASAAGGLTFRRVPLADLAELGVDQATVDVLQELENGQRLFLFVIEPQEHDYTYTAVADETFTLTARLEAQVHNTPAGTGIAAVLGRPFSALASIVEPALPGVNGALLQRSINQVVAQETTGGVSSNDTSDSRPLARACGAMGSLLLPIAWGFLAAVRLARRRR